jgi:DNA mismatch endonuclease (patch repair protein)
MRAVGSKGTAAELAVRAALRPLGLRMRYNVPYLPGKPDIAIHALKVAIFVHGCFWHGHGCKRGARTPKTNVEYWVAKVARNRARDRRTAAALRQAGWSVITVWECQDERVLRRKLRPYLP